MSYIENTILQASTMILAHAKIGDVVKIGETLLADGFEELTEGGGYWITDLETQITYYSPCVISSLEFTKEEFPFLNETWQKHIFKEGLKLAFESFTKHIESGGKYPYHVEVKYRKKNGGVLPLICSGKLVKINKINKYLVGTHKLQE